MEKLISSIETIISRSGGTWGIVLKDLQTGKSWNKNATLPFYPASVIKLPVMAAVFSKFEQETMNPEDTVLLQQDDLVGGSGVLQHMTPGTEITISDLVTLMIIQSDNTATNILIDLAGKTSINALMKEIGMHRTVLHNKLMLDDKLRQAENMTAAADIAIFLEKLHGGQIVSEEASAHMIDIMKQQQIRDCLPGKLQYAFPEDEYEWQLAHKTGWIPGYRHDAGVFFTGNRSCVAAIFSKEVDDYESAIALSDIGLKIYKYLQEK